MGFSGISKGELERLTEAVLAELRLRLEGGQKERYCGNARQNGVEGGLENRSGKRLLLMGETTPEEAEVLKNSYAIEHDLKACGWDILLITQLSTETMAYAAHGISGNEEASCLLRGLLEGRKIFLLQRGVSFRNYRESAAKNLYSMYLNQEDTLRNLGVEMISHVSDMENNTRAAPGIFSNGKGRTVPGVFAARAENKEGVLPEKAGRYLDFSCLRLLREADLSGARNMGTAFIRLGRDTIITPLAMDFIKNHSLSVIRE